ncbi:serine/threonine-protein kinase [Streptomyces cylindrosporus]|uniref:non-specific serine/threonine protein kinase n=1 Tax=Streptomyces cylindrosporus TaxID=2927583 RepID=A0ABS9YDD2_9ACTN|nr:serine/threonine-protein kinase [Streptomyces cylindrosporus]MCI3275240.1 protein kinase [Streptomyces cylindrosporus]
MASGESSGGNGQADGTGRLLAGRYRVLSQLGRGGMGVVWRAVDEVLGREVAVKELRTYSDADGPELADLRVRMQREARAAARVRHPGVVAVHDIGEVDGRPLIVMELVDGPSLDDVLRERGPLDPREAAGIGAKVMDALAAAHRAGVLHRDVKPGNILLERSGRVVLTDFGIATMEDPDDGSETHLTRTGALVGSLDYLAPERAQGGDPGPPSDIWALGATLYAAVEGSSPFRRTSTYSTLTAIIGEPLPEPQRAGALGPVLRQLMDKRPEARPEAEEAVALLQGVADATGTDTPTTTLRGATPPRSETERSVPPVPGPVGSAGPGTTGPAAAQGPGGRDATSPAVAQGFGAAQPPSPAGTPGFGTPAQGVGPFGQPAPAPHGYGAPVPPDQAITGPMAATSDSPRRNKGRVLLAAVAVVLVLAAAGTAVALLNDKGDAEAGDRPSSSATSATATSSASERADAGHPSGSKSPERGGKKTPTATATPGGKGGSEPSSGASESSPAHSSGGGTTGGGTSGGTTGGSDGGGSGSGGTTGGSGSTSPAPACTSIGGGKYNCTVWREAKSHTASGTEVGVLGAGTNYFFCQQNLGRRETYGQWTNVWWAKTDDDSGNTNVYVSDVYIKGGDNDEPIPGLPVC